MYINNLLSKYDDADIPEILDRIYSKLHFLNKTSQYFLQCNSTKKIPFQLPIELRNKITAKPEELFQSDEGRFCTLPPSECPDCHTTLPTEKHGEVNVSTLLTKYSCIPILCKGYVF